VLVTLLRHLDRSRFHLSLVVVDMSGAVFEADLPNDVGLIDLQCSRVLYALPKISRLIWQRRPNVVFTTLGHLNLALAIIRPLLPNRVLYVAREATKVSEGLRAYRMHGLWRWAYRQFYPRFNFMVCQSRSMRDDLVNNFALPPDKTVVIQNPLDMLRIHKLADQPLPYDFQGPDRKESGAIHLLAAGRLDREKGFDLLIKALALCDDPRLRLTLLGEGPLRGELERLAEESKVAWQVRFAGFQINPYPFYAQADAFVLSSRYEGLPNVVLEALACGTPVIATPASGGVKEILEGLEGCVLSESISAERLAEALRSWVSGPRRRIDTAVVQPYEVSRIAAQYESILLN
jgi:glycosyltransferase involved in cell wall biosynthesis